MVCLALAKENNLDIEFVETPTPVESLEYRKLNPLGRVPTFEAANGWVLTECIAISIYCTLHHHLLHSKAQGRENFIQYSYPCHNLPVDYPTSDCSYSGLRYLLCLNILRIGLTIHSCFPKREDHSSRKDQARLRSDRPMDVIRQRRSLAKAQ